MLEPDYPRLTMKSHLAQEYQKNPKLCQKEQMFLLWV